MLFAVLMFAQAAFPLKCSDIEVDKDIENYQVNGFFDTGPFHEYIDMIYDRKRSIASMEDITTLSADAFVTRCRAILKFEAAKSEDFERYENDNKTKYVVSALEREMKSLRSRVTLDYDLRKTDDGKTLVDYVNR